MDGKLALLGRPVPGEFLRERIAFLLLSALFNEHRLIDAGSLRLGLLPGTPGSMVSASKQDSSCILFFFMFAHPFLLLFREI